MREGGDKQHDQAVHYKKDAWTKAIADHRGGRVKDEMRAVLAGQRDMWARTITNADALHADAAKVFEELHQVPMESPEEREALYRKSIEDRDDLRVLREAFDTWCAVWFWPADRLEDAPMPRGFSSPPSATKAIVAELRAQYRFFHWELEFPDVFARAGGGFDAMVGNPPWEIQKPNSLEFFSNLDPLYRTYTKTEATKRQREIFSERASDERAWIEYNARLKALSNWVKNVGSPFGDGADGGTVFSLGKGIEGFVADWAKERAGNRGFVDGEHPFRHQGSADVNTYKLFLEETHALLRKGGALGMLVPSGIYSDLGTKDLRKLFLERCRWEFLYAFQNERFVFANVDHRFKVAVVGVTKGERTEAIATRFRLGPGGSPEVGELADDIVSPAGFLRLHVARIAQFSPSTLAFLELDSDRDLNVLQKMYDVGVLLGDKGVNGWQLRYATEFHMTNDATLFPSRGEWEARGFRADRYGRWQNAEGDVALPLYQGVMIQQFDFAPKGWVEGTGVRAKWRPIDWSNKQIEPQFLMAREVYTTTEGAVRGLKLAFRDIARSTDERTIIATILPDMPCGNVLGVLSSPSRNPPPVLACFNSYVLDSCVRLRMAGTHLNLFVIEELPLVQPLSAARTAILSQIVYRLSFPDPVFGPEWLCARSSLPNFAWKRLWAITPHERLRLRSKLDAIVAALYGLDENDFRWILRDCDHPAQRVCEKTFSRTLDPKGFWRVDKDKDPELRHTVLSQIAFHDLQQTIAEHGGDRDQGIEAFCNQNDGDGWKLPESLRLSDYGIGHDERAEKPQPVASRLGERFLPWQLEQSVEESWRECEEHAKKLLGEEGFARLMAEIGKGTETGEKEAAGKEAAPAKEAAASARRQMDLFGNPVETDLFGNPVVQGKGRRGRR